MREQGSKKGIFTNYSKKILAIIMMITIVGGLMPNTILIADAAQKKARALKLNKANLEMFVGQKQTLKVTKVTPAKASKEVTWKTSNKKVATVNSKGKVTAKKAGSAKITAVSKSNSKVKVTCKIKVYNKPKSIELNKTKYTLEVGDSFKLKIKSATPKNAYKKVKFSSTNSGVVEVEDDGTVYGVSAGTATIKARSVWNSKVKASCVINVKDEKRVTPTPTAKPSRIPEVTVSPTKTPIPTTGETTKPTVEATVTPTLKTERVLLSGTYENTSWTIDENGLLEISGTGEMYKYIEQENWMFVGYTMLTPWGEYRDIIKSAKVNVTDVKYLKKMFYGCENLEHIDLTGLQADNVVDMSYMFGNCKKLKTIIWGDFKTENVTNMSSMFSGCSSLEEIDLSPLNTENVINMGGMFSNCTQLEEIDLSPLNTENVTSMSSMFSGCSSLETIDLSPLNTENVTNIGSMFSGCISLKTIDLTPLNTKNVTDISSMFLDCHSLETVDLSPLNTENVTNMGSMFSNCDSLETIDLSTLNTENVTDMGSIFSGCDSLNTIDLRKLNTGKVQNISGMFSGCKNLKNIDISTLNTESVTKMSYMFSGCSSLETMDLSGISMQNVTDVRRMFAECLALENLDISNITAAKLEYTQHMLHGCENLKKFDVSKGMLNATIALPGGLWKDENGTYYATISGNYAENTILKPLPHAEAKAIEGDIVKSGTYGQVTWTLDRNGKLEISGMGNVCDEEEEPKWLDENTDSYNGYVNYDIKEVKIDLKYATDLSRIFRHCKNLEKADLTGLDMSTVEDTSGMFSGCSSLTTVAFGANVTSNLNNAYSMFQDCEKLETIDMSSIECKIESFYNFCDNCTSLKEINLQNMSLSGVGDGIADNCKNLEKIITPKTTNEEEILIEVGTWMDEEGNECNAIPKNRQESTILTRNRSHSGTYENTTWSIDDNGLLTVTGTGNMYQPYQECKYSDYDDWDDWQEAQEENYPAWKKYKDDIVSAVIDVQGATNAYGLFYDCNCLNHVDLSKFDMSQITNASEMFYGCSNLKSIEQKGWNFSELVNASNMFRECGLEKIDFSTINVDTLEDISYMFSGCSNLKWIDLSGMTLGNLTEKAFDEVFSGCSNLTYIKTPSIIGSEKIELDTQLYTNAGKWKDTNGVVYKYLPTNIQCSIELTKEIDTPDVTTPIPTVTTTPVPSITPIPTDEDIIYSGSYEQTSWTIDKDGLLEVTGEGDTYRAVRYAFSTYYDDEYGYELRPQWTWYNDYIKAAKLNVKNTNEGSTHSNFRLLYNCNKLKYLDLSGFEVQEYNFVLSDLTALETIITPKNLGDAEVKLPIGIWLDSAGKRYYYLPETSKTLNIQAKVMETNTYRDTEWFIDENGLFELTGKGDYYSGSDSRNGSAPYWNGNETVVKAVVNLQEVVEASKLFKDFYKLQEIDITNLDLKKAETMAYMFAGCKKLEQLDLSMLDTANVESMEGLFYGCSGLKQVDLSSFDTGNVTDMKDMFYGCGELKQVNLSGFDTDNTTNMAYMFDGCVKLDELDLSMLNTVKVEDMEGMFYECSSLKQIDLSSFDTGNVIDMEDMFYGCDELTIIKTPCSSGETTTDLPEGIWEDENGNKYTELPVNAEKSIVLTKVGEIEVDEGEIGTMDEITLSTPVMQE